MDDPGRTYRLMVGTFVGAGSGARVQKVHDTGRVCSAPECTTLLSIYNPSDRCAVHPSLTSRSKTRGDARSTGSTD